MMKFPPINDQSKNYLVPGEKLRLDGSTLEILIIVSM